MVWYERGRKKQKRKEPDPNRTTTCDVCGKSIRVMDGNWVVLANRMRVHHITDPNYAEEDCLNVLRKMRATNSAEAPSPRVLYVED